MVERCSSRFSLARGRWQTVGFECGVIERGCPALLMFLQPSTGGTRGVDFLLRRGNSKVPDAVFVRGFAFQIPIRSRFPPFLRATFGEQAGDGPKDSMFPTFVFLSFVFRHR